LLSSDAVRDLQFYADLFGWIKTDEFDMGEMGIYHMFGRDGVTMGGMLTVKHDPEALRWLYYFNVATIDAAVERVYQHGGTVSLEPRQVPGGSWIAQCADAQGGVFGLAAPAR
jgi:predicted enzyme related to lactoylglutathione lyase